MERVHQVVGNIVRTFELQDNHLDEDNPWKDILCATSFAIRSTCHTTLQKTPGQLVFGRDMILNVEHAANWECIRQRKQKIIAKNNGIENSKRKPHEYKAMDKAVLTIGTTNKCERPHSVPHATLKVHTNGTIRLQMGTITDAVNIRRIEPVMTTPGSSHGGEWNMRMSRRRRK